MAVKDVAVISNLFSHPNSNALIIAILKAIKTLCLSCASVTQPSSRLSQQIFHPNNRPDH